MYTGHNSRAAGLAVVLLEAIPTRLLHKSSDAFCQGAPCAAGAGPAEQVCDTIRRTLFAFDTDEVADEPLAGQLSLPSFNFGRVAPESKIS